MARANKWMAGRFRRFLTHNDLGVILPLFSIALGFALWSYFDQQPAGAEELPFAHYLATQSGMHPVLWIQGLVILGVAAAAWRSIIIRGLNLLLVSSFIFSVVTFGAETGIQPLFVMVIELAILPLVILLVIVISTLRAAMDRCAKNELALAEALEHIQVLQEQHKEERTGAISNADSIPTTEDAMGRGGIAAGEA